MVLNMIAWLLSVQCHGVMPDACADVTGVLWMQASNIFGDKPAANQRASSNGLLSLVPNRQNQLGFGLGKPPKPPGTQAPVLGSAQAQRQSTRKGSVLQAEQPRPCHGTASFPYFAEGFMTQPFRCELR